MFGKDQEIKLHRDRELTDQRDTYTCCCVQSSETICVGSITGAFICVPEREVVYAGTESRTGN